MPRSLIAVAVLLAAGAAAATFVNQAVPKAQAHCQVPCGIFDEEARIKALYEDATTIEKSMRLMNELAGKADAQSQQQFVRWTITKEEHASRMITVTSEYFLAQKLKPVAKDAPGYGSYLAKLALHHDLIITAMKAKQTTDAAAVKKLRDAIHGIEQIWVATHQH